MTTIDGLTESANNVDVMIKGKLHRFTETDFFQRYQVSGMNRLPLHQFESLKQSQLLSSDNLDKLTASDKQFVRFSLEKNLALVGSHYVVLPIIKSGKDTSCIGYQAPILSVDNALIFKAEKITNHLSYRQVNELVTQQSLNFEHSVENITNIETLQQEIICRYLHSRPQLSESEIVQLGVGIVWFTWIGFVDEKNQVQYLKD